MPTIFSADQFDWPAFIEAYRKQAVHGCLAAGRTVAASVTERILGNLKFVGIEREVLGPNTYLVLRMECADRGVKMLAEGFRGGLVVLLAEWYPLGKRQIWMPEFVVEGEGK